jgi:3-oxoadipate enol-lactonase
MEMLTADAVGLMDALGLEKVHFCGLSKGGMVGQMLGTHYADRLISLILCDTAAHLGPKEIWEERMAAVNGGGMGVLVDAFIDRWFTKPGQKRMPEEVKKVRAMISATPIEGFCGCCCAIRDMDQRESIRAITTPTLVMVGEHDPGTPVSAATFIHERIASSQMKIIDDAAHFINVEQKSVFNDTLLGFLAANGGAF